MEGHVSHGAPPSRVLKSGMVAMVPVLRRVSPRTLKRTHSLNHNTRKHFAAKKLTFTSKRSSVNDLKSAPDDISSRNPPVECHPQVARVRKKTERPPKSTEEKRKDAADPTAEVPPPHTEIPPVGGKIKRKRLRPTGRRSKQSLKIDPKHFTSRAAEGTSEEQLPPTTLEVKTSKIQSQHQATVVRTLDTASEKSHPSEDSLADHQPAGCKADTTQVPHDHKHCEKVADISHSSHASSEDTDFFDSHIDYPPPSTPQQKEVRRLARVRQIEECKKRDGILAREERIRKRKGLPVGQPVSTKRKKILWRQDLVEMFVYSPVKETLEPT